MKHKVLTLLLALTPLVASAGTPCADGSGAQAAVGAYLTAMQEHRFNDAYAFVTSAMTDGKPRDEWAALQKMFYQGGAVNILRIDTREAIASEEDSACTGMAIVPNVLESRDKFNNQGTTEFEIYTVVHDGEAWRIDSQETLFDQGAVERWFPGEKMPEFRDQY